MTHDPIIAADRAEEQAAAMSLNAAKTAEDLGLVWSMECEHFTGDARVRLTLLYRERIGHLAPMSRAD
jgi:hypothetical protein